MSIIEAVWEGEDEASESAAEKPIATEYDNSAACLTQAKY